jgi:hypothetical protein
MDVIDYTINLNKYVYLNGVDRILKNFPAAQNRSPSESNEEQAISAQPDESGKPGIKWCGPSQGTLARRNSS